MRLNYLQNKAFLFTILTLLSTAPALGQQQVQTIRGTIADQQSKKGLGSVSVSIPGTSLGGITDSSGTFVIYRVPVGRVAIQVSHIGYEPVQLQNIVVESGKETVLNLELLEKLGITQKEIIIAGRHEKLISRQMATVSAFEFNAEDSRRYAGSRNDVARMAANFAGVNSVNDGRNDIIIRGNSPLGLL